MSNTQKLTLRQGLTRYYEANPHFSQGKDLYVGWIRVPWSDLQKHDMMHVVTGYSTALDQELRLIGFLLTALTWWRPWYYYLQSFGVFLELLWQSSKEQMLGNGYMSPAQVCQHYWVGILQGQTVHKRIKASIDPETVMERTLLSLREEYGIANAGHWDV
jgi:ubiquinone biosynthesis protein Coq4